MNLAIAPNTPIAHSVPITKQAFAHPTTVGDNFAATFGKATPKVEDITTYTTFNEKGLDPTFKANVSEGILKAMQSFPEQMAHELLDEDYQFSVGNQLVDVKGDKIFHAIELDKFIKSQKPYGEESKSFIKDCAKNYKKELENLIQDTGPLTPSTILDTCHQKFKTLLEAENLSHQETAELELLNNFYFLYTHQNGICNLPLMRKTAIFQHSLQHDNIDRNTDHNWGIDGVPVLERIVRHETVHAIDFILGPKKTGKNFSSNPTFQKLLLLDSIKSKEKETWPMSDEAVNFSENLQNIGQMFHYFPEHFPDLDKIGSNNVTPFREAFAECLSALTGGGAVDADRVKGIYKNGCEWVKHNVLMPYERPAFLNNPFKWLKLTAQMGWYNLKTNLMLFFTKTPQTAASE